MEIRTLTYFLAVAREGNMTEAANSLYVTQPTLSRQMADLEKELGKKLFIRGNRSTTLTEEGMHLRQRAEEILDLVHQTKEEIQEDTLELTGTIRIGGGETVLMHFLTDTFVELKGEYPRLTIQLSTGNVDTIEEKLSHGLLDFGLMIEPFQVEDYEYIRLPEKDQVGIVTSLHSPWAKYKAITPELLPEIPLILPACIHNKSFDLETWSQGKVTTDQLTVVGWMDLIGNASHLIRSGIASSLSVTVLDQFPRMDLKFIPLAPALFTTSVVIWKKYRLMNRACEAFLQRLKKHVENWQPKP